VSTKVSPEVSSEHHLAAKKRKSRKKSLTARDNQDVVRANAGGRLDRPGRRLHGSMQPEPGLVRGKSRRSAPGLTCPWRITNPCSGGCQDPRAAGFAKTAYHQMTLWKLELSVLRRVPRLGDTKGMFVLQTRIDRGSTVSEKNQNPTTIIKGRMTLFSR